MKSFLAAVAVCSFLFATSANAGVLDGIAGAFNDGTGPGIGGAWSGTSSFDNFLAPPFNLQGTVDFAVMESDDFAAAFPGASYSPTNALVYLYQVVNTGTFNVSAEIVSLTNPASGIGQFESGVAGPVEIASDLFGFGTGGNAILELHRSPDRH